MATENCPAKKRRAVVFHSDEAIPGREHFAVPPRWEAEDGPIFDAIELAPVAIFEDDYCEPFESLSDVPKSEVRQVIWSIYGHTPGEGVQCIGDFTTRDHALEVIRRLLGNLRPYRGGA